MKSKTAMNICKQFRHVYRTGYCDLQYICPSSMITTIIGLYKNGHVFLTQGAQEIINADSEN